jgi:hypothetical protein
VNALYTSVIRHSMANPKISADPSVFSAGRGLVSTLDAFCMPFD